ncbi:MAG: hypothetical protein CM1200mP2_08240 [Planctomycetaceae bacterium]|nr:MAG: hypothetical protein CM1200mP2_08240 [Planctomycetaceae bacterium]
MSQTDSRVALITGGARGIGLGIARSLASEGWRLALGGRRPAEDVAGVMKEFEQDGVEACYCWAMSRRRTIATEPSKKGRERFGALHLLVNNAGITSPGRRDILEADEESFDRVLGVNLKGPFFLTQAWPPG